jgi:hypothetical protein
MTTESYDPAAYFAGAPASKMVDYHGRGMDLSWPPGLDPKRVQPGLYRRHGRINPGHTFRVYGLVYNMTTPHGMGGDAWGMGANQSAPKILVEALKPRPDDEPQWQMYEIPHFTQEFLKADAKSVSDPGIHFFERIGD